MLRNGGEAVTSPRRVLRPASRPVDAAGVLPLELSVAYSLIGLGGVLTAAAGLLLPPGERLTAVLALVAGGGVGVIALAIGSSFVDDSSSFETLFLVASILGFVATTVTAALLLRAPRHGADPATRVSDRAA